MHIKLFVALVTGLSIFSSLPVLHYLQAVPLLKFE